MGPGQGRSDVIDIPSATERDTEGKKKNQREKEVKGSLGERSERGDGGKVESGDNEKS